MVLIVVLIEGFVNA